MTFEERSEIMRQTTCSPSGYGSLGFDAGNHQYCRQETQTQSYKVPIVTQPVVGSCLLSYPEPRRVCTSKAIDITEVKCDEKIDRKCLNTYKLNESTNRMDEKTIITGPPKCDQFTLALPTQACKRGPSYASQG